jgi:uncharacterized membrane protein required for colicin V production
MNYFDLLIVLVLLVAFYSGYKNGLIKTMFRTAGYITGGVAGLALAVKFLATWGSQSQKVAFALLTVFIGASLGEFLLGKIGSLFRKVLFIPPFEFIDSVLGALVSLIRTSFILCLVVIFLIFSMWHMAEKYVKPSVSYQVIEAQLPAVLTTLKNYFG